MNFNCRTFISLFVAASILWQPVLTYAAETPQDQTGSSQPHITYINASGQSATAPVAPIVEYTTTMTDPETGAEQDVSIEYAVSHNQEEYIALSQLMQHQLREEKTAGADTAVVTTNFEGDDKPAVDVRPEDWGVTAEQVSRVTFLRSKWLQFQEFVRNAVEKAEAGPGRSNDVARDQELFMQDRARRARGFTRWERLLRWFQGDLTKTSPWKLDPVERSNPTRIYEATFTILRASAVAGAVAAGFIFNHDMTFDQTGIWLSSALMGVGSGLIMVNGNYYLKWFKNFTFFSRTIIRPAYRLALHTANLVPVATQLLPKWLRLNPLDVQAMDEKFANGAIHNLINGAFNYVTTEVPFLLIAALSFAICGQNIYPHMADWMQYMTPGHWFSHAEAASLGAGYVIYSILKSSISAYQAQGLLDGANSVITAAKKDTIDARLAAMELTPEEAELEHAKVEFKSQFLVFGVSVGSNFGVVMGIPHTPLAMKISEKIIKGMTWAGAVYYAYGTVRHDKSFLRFVKDLVLPKPTNETCVDIVQDDGEI